MALKGRIIINNFRLFFLVSIIIIPCYNCFHPLDHDYYLEEGNNHEAYPSYFSFIGVDDGRSILKSKNNVLNLQIFDKVGTTSTSPKIISVDDFGAKADGTDDTQAFVKAWKEACSSKGGATLVVPEKNTYKLKPIRFSGPCSSNLTLQISGSIKAWEDRSAYQKDTRHWLVFDEVDNLVVEGGGSIDGNGNIWWQNSCKVNKNLPCKHAPTAVTFYKCKNLEVKNLKIQNAQQMHISFQSCRDVKVSNLSVSSPGHSPNTDGIHVTQTKNIIITNSVIGTGDDCISIVSGSQNVQAMDITCGPGHGISIGSLGSGGSRAYVSGIIIDGAKISDTSNGVRIKTWQGGSGIASQIQFLNIEMDNVTNPILIDQNYCDQKTPCKEQKSAVQVKNVLYKNIKGTSASDVAIKFDCSKTNPCQGIILEDVVLNSEGGDQTTKASCENVKLTELGVVSPQCP